MQVELIYMELNTSARSPTYHLGWTWLLKSFVLNKGITKYLPNSVTLKGFKGAAVNWLVTNSVMTVHPWSPTGPWWPPWLVPWPPCSTFPYITPLDQHPFNWPPLLFIHPGFLTGGSFLHSQQLSKYFLWTWYLSLWLDIFGDRICSMRSKQIKYPTINQF